MYKGILKVICLPADRAKEDEGRMSILSCRQLGNNDSVSQNVKMNQ